MALPTRHGDVALHPAALPKGAKEVITTKSFIAQEGEVTGHHHVIEGTDEFQVFETKGQRYFVFSHAVEISHPEHRTYTIPPGTYRQGQEIEEDPFADEIRVVLD